METIILLVVVLFALVGGFFLGIFFVSLDTPLTKNLISSSADSDNTFSESTAPSQGPASEETPPPQVEPEKVPEGTSPRADDPEADQAPAGKRILEVWLDDGNSLEFISLGKTYTRDNLPQPLMEMLRLDEPGPGVSPPLVTDLDQEATPQRPQGRGTKPEKKEIKMLSVIEEIDNILQEKLESSPLNERGIQLLENQQKEIRIWVGLQSYDAVDDVPDPEIRALILESVEEWENSED